MEATATCSLSAAPKALADHLAAVKPAVASRSAVQTLTGVRIFVTHTAKCRAYLEATDMEVAVRRDILRDLHSVTVGGELDVIVSHADLAKAVKLFAKREVVTIVDHDADNVAVTDGQRTIKLRKLRRPDWPPFAADGADDIDPLFVADSGAELSAVLLRAAMFASRDETRPILTGVAFVYDDGYGEHARDMRVWATDSYRLADLALPARGMRGRRDNGERGIVNVQSRGLSMAAKAMRKAREVVVSTHGNRAIIRFHGEVWTVRLIDGQFPNFRQLIPDTAEVTVKVPAAELVGACDVAGAFARKNAPMRLSVNGVVKVTGSTPDVCEFEELLTGASYTVAEGGKLGPDDELVIGLNPEFTADIVKAHVGETIELRLISPLRPALYVDGDDIYLQMPIRLNV